MRRFLALSMTALLVGCPNSAAPSQTPAAVAGDPTAKASNNIAFVGLVKVPSELISNNVGGLISNNVGGYRISALSEVPLGHTLVYLLNLDEDFYQTESGEQIVTTTDAGGRYRLSAVLPANRPVILSALLAGNRRMVGYTIARDGENEVNISLASTYVTEYFRAQAAAGGKTMADYPQALSLLPELTAETQKLLEEGSLPIPDLTIGQAPRMNKGYFAVFGSRSKRLSDLWAQLLDQRKIALSTVAGNYSLGSIQEEGIATQLGLSRPTGVAIDPSGILYVAVQESHILRKITPDGRSSVLGSFRGDGSVTTPTLSSDGVEFAQLSLPVPQDVTCDQDGNVLVVPGANPGPTFHNNVLIFLCMKTGPYFGGSFQAGHAYILGSDSPKQGTEPLDRFKDGPIAQARFQTPWGACFDEAGNLFVADRWNNLIRRIDRQTGQVETVAGRLAGTPGAQYGDPLDSWDGTSGDGGPALGAVIVRPFDISWRKVSATVHELYVWEGTHPSSTSDTLLKAGNAIRRISYDPAHATQGIVSTLAGGADSLRGFSGDDGPASTAKIRLVDPSLSQDIPNGGIAISPTGRYLYFCDTYNYRIRRIDLTAEGGPRIETVAGGGTIEGDAEASKALLKDVSGLAVDASESVYFCDTQNHVVRRLNLQFGP